MENPRSTDYYDYTTWNGLLVQYVPPIDYTGLEYGMSGYDPQIANQVAATMVLNFDITFQFKGKLPLCVQDNDYSSINRGYHNTQMDNAVVNPWQ